MSRTAVDDATWWMFLGVVTRDEEGGFTTTGPVVNERLERMERAGLLWLKRRGPYYVIQPTDEGVRAVRRWSARRAKECAVEFGRP